MLTTKEIIYLDHNATTPLDPRVVAAMMPFFEGRFGNPSSVHSHGQHARYWVDDARQKVAAFLGADPEEIVFTSGGTESCNAAVLGFVRKMGDRGTTLVSSRVEHPAVLRCVEYLQETKQADVHWIDVDTDGVVNLEQMNSIPIATGAFVTVMAANNDVGTLMPVAKVAEIAHSNGAMIHTDAVQAVGKIPLDVKELNVDLLSCSSHKLNGPMGVGALYVKRGTRISPTTFGGHQESRRRAGTENVAAIVGFGVACELLASELEQNASVVSGLKSKLELGLNGMAGVTIYGEGAQRLPGTCYAGFAGVEGETLQMALDMKGLAVSVGSACSSESRDPSHVLTAMGVSASDASSAIRFSLGPSNTAEEVDLLLHTLEQLLGTLRCD